MASGYYVTRAAQEVALVDGCARILEAGIITGYRIDLSNNRDGEPVGIATLEIPGFDQEVHVDVNGGYAVSVWKHVRGRHWKITAHSGHRCDKGELATVTASTIDRARTAPFSNAEANELQGSNWVLNLGYSLLPYRDRA